MYTKYHTQCLNGLSGLKQQDSLTHFKLSKNIIILPKNPLELSKKNLINLGKGNSKQILATSVSGGAIRALVGNLETTFSGKTKYNGITREYDYNMLNANAIN